MPGEESGPNILQIMAADGWVAVMLQSEPPYYFTVRLCGWALVEDEEGGRSVVGLDAGEFVDIVEDLPAFHAYAHEADITDAARAEWSAAGQARALGEGDLDEDED